jgi:hypothetical protein
VTVYSQPDAHWWKLFLRSRTLRSGLTTGCLLALVMSGSLFAANRMPWLEHWALERNATSWGVFAIVMLLPIAAFRHSPLRLFAAGMIAWTLLTAAYWIAGMYFVDLSNILRTPFQVLLDGAVIYGVVAVVLWVASMAWQARRVPAITGRRRPGHLHR